MFILSAFIFILIFTSANSQRHEFEICKVGIDGQLKHVCRKIYDCPTALYDISQNRTPSLCGFYDNTPIVCCEPSKVEGATTTAIGRPCPEIPTSSQNAISIVNCVCTRYKEEQYNVTWLLPQLIEQKPTKKLTPRCASDQQIPEGRMAISKEFPHMALVGYGASISSANWNCGGSLISEQFVLTAAHCVDVTKTSLPKWVRLGYTRYIDIRFGYYGPAPQDFNIIERILHPNYQSAYVYDDIALLKLNKVVLFNEYIRPVCLDTSPDISHKKGIATDWGKGYSEHKELLKMSFSFIDKATCDSLFGGRQLNQGINPDKMVCATVEDGCGKENCEGDYGNPIQVKINGEPCMYAQIGIASFGTEFYEFQRRLESPIVYTRIYNYLPWIQSIVWP